MSLNYGIDSTEHLRGGYVAIGNFDGVHRGHRGIAGLLVERARADDVPAVVVTFDPHPIRLLRPEVAPPSLTTVEQKVALLQGCGVDAVAILPTDRALLSMSPAEFFENVLVEEFDPRGLVEGPNFQFGKDRAGDIAALRSLCDEGGRTLDIATPVEFEGEVVSSSRIRRSIADGEMERAVEMLGHPYGVVGTVARGAGRGRTLGFPTVNLEGIETLMPPDGVYGGRVRIDGTDYLAAVHIGGNPTFDDDGRKFEAHLIDFEGDLYDRQLEVALEHRVRGSRRFENPESLREQLQADIAEIRTRLTS